VLMEALQLLKFSLKKERLNFTKGWLMSETAMLEASQPAPDILGSLLVKDPDRVVDNILVTLDD